MALLAAAVALVAFGLSSWRSVTNDGAAVDDDLTTTSTPPLDPAPAAGPSGLLVHAGADGEVVALTVLATRAVGAGGEILFVPAGSMVEVPSYGLDTFRAASSAGGLTLVQQSLENLLGVQFDEVALVGPAEVVSLVAPAGPLDVELGEAVEEVTGAGRVETHFPVGTAEVAPERVPELLELEGSGTELDLLVRHQAFWESWLDAVDGLGAPPGDGAVGGDDDSTVAGGVLPSALQGIDGLVRRLAGGEVGFTLLPVAAVTTSLEDQGDVFRVSDAELPRVVARLFPGRPSDAEARFSVQVLNGTGQPGLAQLVQPELVPAGGQVTLTDNADRFDYRTTSIVYYQDTDAASALAVRDALGVGEVVRSRAAGRGVVTVTVVVGADFLAATSAGARS